VENLLPPFSFGAIVKPEETVPDGQVIKLIDPAYTQLVFELIRNPQIIYKIDSRKWEEIIAAAYDKAGFDQVILTPRSGDKGRDVIAIKHGFGSVKFIEQVKAYNYGHVVKADEVRALLGVLQAEQDASKAIFTTTSTFAPRIEQDKFIKPYLPYRLELIDKDKLLKRLISEIGTRNGT
jgi:restriction system protein